MLEIGYEVDKTALDVMETTTYISDLLHTSDPSPTLQVTLFFIVAWTV